MFTFPEFCEIIGWKFFSWRTSN